MLYNVFVTYIYTYTKKTYMHTYILIYDTNDKTRAPYFELAKYFHIQNILI